MSSNENRKIKRKVRKANFISTVSIALVLFLLGAMGYLIMGALGASNRLKESFTVSVMLNDGTTAERVAEIGKTLEANDKIKEVRFISKAEAAADFKSFITDDFEEFLNTNPLPDSYEVTLNAKGSEKDIVEALEEEMLAMEGVYEVVYQRNVVEQIGSNINRFNFLLLFFGTALLLISMILLNNTIRVTIYSKRNIINTMKLVGATRGFIMRPFIWRSIRHGVYAGLISWAMLAVMIGGLYEGLPEVRFVSQNLHLIYIFAAMMIGGILISLIFTTFAVRKFLRMNTSGILIY